MKFKTFLAVALLTAAVPTFAASKIYAPYETTRQALIKGSIPEIQTGAKQLAVAAQSEKQTAVAVKANNLVKAGDLTAARNAFAALSDEVIKVRAADKGDRPIVAYCTMEKKSWLQPNGEISNPYVGAGMRKCGEVRAK